ncbi:GtrA family protein [Terrilactibacillus sp. BCM23-1]|uniref:GtrA family protein n=1 Tax=Terrilactibacillus tamarindi TaxID=2599694 RepID=A0A6N8CNZ1_9BACI|nr:GtrA family protein [Terrilactibacillus tamarindi]MTT31884.1 GtrA family protein [Terrilactibacillus tamarindi]
MSNSIVSMIKFGIVGCLNTLIDFIVFALLTALGLPYVISQCISYGAGVLNSYVLNRSWTFEQKNQTNKTQEFVKFVLINMITLLITLSLLAYFYQVIGLPQLVSKAMATIIGVAINFIGSRFWVFKAERTKKKNIL